MRRLVMLFWFIAGWPKPDDRPAYPVNRLVPNWDREFDDE